MTKKITPQRRVHDFRRTAAREFRRAGVSEGEIMRLCGWETRTMFDRYNIIDEQDRTRAVARRCGTVVAELEPSKESSPSLS
jgi:integrase